MRRQHQRPSLSSFASSTGFAAKIFKASASITAGISSPPASGHKLHRLRQLPNPRPDGQHRLPGHQRRTRSAARFSSEIEPEALAASGHVISSGATAENHRQSRRRNRRRHQSRAHAQSSQGRHRRRARLAAADPNVPPPPAHVQTCPCSHRPRAVSAPSPSPNPSSAASARKQSPPPATRSAQPPPADPPPRQLPKHMRRLGAVNVITASEGNTGASMLEDVASAAHRKADRRKARRLARLHPFQRRQRNPFNGGLKPVPTTASTIRSVSSALFSRASSSAAVTT